MITNTFGTPRNVAPCGQPTQVFHRASIRSCAQQAFIAIVIAACWITGSLRVNAVQSVTLAWDRGSDSSAIGYRVQAWQENAPTPTSINVLGLTQVTVPNLKEGLRYTFTVTAYNANGLESLPSNPAQFVVPVPLNLLPGATPAAAKRLRFPAAPGKSYELQASTNMTQWKTIWQSGTSSSYFWTEFQDIDSAIPANPRGAYFPQRYYRLKIR